MVNSAKLFMIQSRNSLAANADMNHSVPNTTACILQSVDQSSFAVKQEIHSPCQVGMALPPHNYYSNISDELPLKASPSYMEADVQFNFPNYQLQSGNRFNSHVINETLTQQQSLYLNDDVNMEEPKLKRQYSINTVMEVIDSHDIDDISSCNAFRLQDNQQPNYYNAMLQQSPSAIIQRSETFSSYLQEPDMIEGSDEKLLTVLVHPASDLRGYNKNSPMYGSNASSLDTIPFARNQDSFNDSPASFDCNSQVNSYERLHFSESVDSVFPASDDMRLANHGVYSPFQSDTSSPAFPPGSSDFSRNSKSSQFFSFDNISDELRSSHNVLANQHQHMINTLECQNIPGTSSQTDAFSPYPPKANSNLALSSNGTNLVSKKNFQLEEVNSSPYSDEFHATLATDQEKSDMRRIRNNLACRASRERRKKRKKEKESLIDFLEDKNRHLKEQVRLLEKAVLSAHDDVRRRMSQS